MKLDFHRTIKNNPSLFLLYMIVLIPVLTMVFFLISDYSYREEEEVAKNEQMAKVLAQNLDSYLANVKATLVSVSTLSPIQNGDRSEIENIFQNLMMADNHVSLYWGYDTKGKLIAKYPNLWPDKIDHGFVQSLFNAPTVISEPRTGTMTGMEIITISTVVKDPQGRVRGVIGASIPLEKLRNKLSLKVGNTGFPILVTTTGKFLVHPDREEVSKKMTIDHPIFQKILQGGSGTLDVIAPFDNKRKFFSYVPLQEANWIVIVLQPLSEFQTQTLKFLTRNGVIVVLVLFIVALAAYYLQLLHKREEEARYFQAEKLSIVGQLAAGMAHEIRNPLTSIKGFAQLATTRKDGLPLEYLNIIVKEVEQIESIIKETLLLAKPASTEFKLVNMNQLLEELHTLMQPQANLKNVKLFFAVQENLPQIMGNFLHLKQVLVNMIKNSLDATVESFGEIYIDAKRTNQAIVITIKDNGCGIPEEIMDKLGNPFISTKDNGTGLGLMVSYRIIQNHNGKVSVKSNQENGTTFVIELPNNSLN